MKEKDKYEIIKELVDHGGNKNRVALKLGISKRQVNRLIIKYKEKGKSAFIHGNRSKKPVNALDKSISEDIILLYKNKYQDFNFKHFYEYLIEEEGYQLSYTYVYSTLVKNGILSPKVRKATKKKILKEKLLHEKKLKDKSEEEIDYLVNHEIDLEDAHPRQEKPKNFGEIIEMDGSIHLWFGDKKCCLHLAVDRATNTIVAAWFDKEETLNGYYHLYYQILTKYGIPYKFLTDNRTVFVYKLLNPDKRTSEKDVLTQFGYACKILGTDLETTSVSQAKGLVERDNGTFQDRLVSELRLNGINNMDDANEYLTKFFVPKFNSKFAMNYKKFPSVFEEAPTIEKINNTLAVLTIRKFDNGNAIKFKHHYYQPYLNNELKCFKPKTECLVVESFNGDLLVSIDEQFYELRELSRNERFSKEFETVTETKKERKVYIPPMSHPYKSASFKRQMYKSHYRHVYA